MGVSTRQKLALRVAVAALRLGGYQPYFDIRVSKSEKDVLGARIAGKFTELQDLHQHRVKGEELRGGRGFWRMYVDAWVVDRRSVRTLPKVEIGPFRDAEAAPQTGVTIAPLDPADLVVPPAAAELAIQKVIEQEPVTPRIVAGAMTNGRLHRGAFEEFVAPTIEPSSTAVLTPKSEIPHDCSFTGPLLPSADGTYKPSCIHCKQVAP